MNTLFSLLASLVNLYSIALWARLILSWIPNQSSYNQYGQYVGNKERPLFDFLRKITDPFLNFFKSKKLQIKRIDFSPLLAFMTLNLLKSIFNILSGYGTITIPLIIVLVLQNLWSYLFSYILLAIVIMLVVRLVSFSKPQSNIPNFLDPILNGPVCLVWRIFYNRKTPSEKKLVITSLIFYLAIYLITKNLLSYLVSWLSTK